MSETFVKKLFFVTASVILLFATIFWAWQKYNKFRYEIKICTTRLSGKHSIPSIIKHDRRTGKVWITNWYFTRGEDKVFLPVKIKSFKKTNSTLGNAPEKQDNHHGGSSSESKNEGMFSDIVEKYRIKKMLERKEDLQSTGYEIVGGIGVKEPNGIGKNYGVHEKRGTEPQGNIQEQPLYEDVNTTKRKAVISKNKEQNKR